MTARQPRYSKEEFARRGQALYAECVRPQVERGNSGRIVAIDIETGEFEVGDDALTASGRLLTRCPNAQPSCVNLAPKTGPQVKVYNGAAHKAWGGAVRWSERVPAALDSQQVPRLIPPPAPLVTAHLPNAPKITVPTTALAAGDNNVDIAA